MEIFRKIKSAIGIRSIENPTVPITANNVMEFFGQPRHPTRVDSNSVLGIPAVYGAIKHLASLFGTIESPIYKKTDNGGYKPAKKHPAYKLLTRSPDTVMLISHFKSAFLLQAIVNGNAIALVHRNELEEPEILELVDAKQVQIEYGFYLVHREDGRIENWRHDDVIHLKGLSSDGIKGLPIWEVLRSSLGLSQNIIAFAEKYFQNNCKINLALRLKKPLKTTTDREKLRADMERIHSGTDSAYRVAILEEDSELSSIGQPGHESGMIELSQEQIKAISVIIGCPASFLGQSDSYTSHNSLESQQKQLLANCLNPWLIQWEQACEKVLLSEKEKDSESHYIECNRTKLLQFGIDAATQNTINVAKVNNGLMSWEEFRIQENLPVDKNQTFYRPNNISLLDSEFKVVPIKTQPIQNPQQNQSPNQSPNQKEAALRSKAVEKLITRIAKAVEAKGKGIDFEDHKPVFRSSLDCYENHEEITNKFFDNLAEEIQALSSQDLNKIDFQRYKEEIEKGLE